MIRTIYEELFMVMIFSMKDKLTKITQPQEKVSKSFGLEENQINQLKKVQGFMKDNLKTMLGMGQDRIKTKA